MRTYLSIDIDFWNNLEAAERVLTKLLLRRGDIPTIAVMNHQQLLPMVNESNADVLVNIDEHSDLCDTSVSRFECGSWVSYVKWRKNGKYVWLRNNHGTAKGNCNHDASGWDSGTDWLVTKSYFRGQWTDLCKYLPDCVGIGLCMSPSFSVCGAPELFRMLVKAFDLPYKRGRSKEWFNCTRRPPGIQAA
jgi:hypothetical protein